MTQKIIKALGIFIVLLGGFILGSIPFIVGLFTSLAMKGSPTSRYISLAIVAALFITSYCVGGFDNSYIQANLHASYRIGGSPSLTFNAIMAIIFTLAGHDLARWIRPRAMTVSAKATNTP